MIVIEGNNVNDAFQQFLTVAMASNENSLCREISPRGMKTLEVRDPVATVYRYPKERVLFDPIRDANPFFHLMEALWILAGRNDVAFLDEFNKQMVQFSDNGETFRGAYGNRLRVGNSTTLPNDQITQIKNLFKKDPDTRRGVLAMWIPGLDDVTMDTKDLPCLAGDTILWSPEGDLPIAKVAEKFRDQKISRWPVYSVNQDTKELKLRWATKVWKSGRKKTIRIGFDDGSFLTLTSDHVVYKRKHGRHRAEDAWEVRAGELKIGDRILATRRWFNPRGHEVVKRKLGVNTAFSNIQKTHREYAAMLWGNIPNGFVVHHKNENPEDNREVNLEVIPKSEHDSLHRIGGKNPMRRMTKEQHRKRAVKHSLSIKKYWDGLTPEEKSMRVAGQSDWSRKGWETRREKRKIAEIGNHVVTSIEDWKVEDVYDFTVPDAGTALVGTGVVAHNCNTHIYLKVREGALDMTVCCRSNDALLGCYGANMVHFSVLQEYLAAHIGVLVGPYTQISDSLHVYTDSPVWQRLRDRGHVAEDMYMKEDRWGEKIEPFPLVQDPKCFDDDLQRFFGRTPDTWARLIDPIGFSEPFFKLVVFPMLRAWYSRKSDFADTLLEGVGGWYQNVQLIHASDWRTACLDWCERREPDREENLGYQ